MAGFTKRKKQVLAQKTSLLRGAYCEWNPRSLFDGWTKRGRRTVSRINWVELKIKFSGLFSSWRCALSVGLKVDRTLHRRSFAADKKVHNDPWKAKYNPKLALDSPNFVTKISQRGDFESIRIVISCTSTRVMTYFAVARVFKWVGFEPSFF